MENENDVLAITNDILQTANISAQAGLTVTSLNKAVIITETDTLNYVPDKLLDLFEEFGISQDTVRSILAEDNGILEALMARV